MRSLARDTRWALRECTSPQCIRFMTYYRTYSHITPAKRFPHSPTPTQLLRFAIAGTTHFGTGKKYETHLDRTLKYIFQERKRRLGALLSNVHHRSMVDVLPGQRKLDVLLADIQHLVKNGKSGEVLMVAFDALGNGLRNCSTRVEVEDVLVAINGILARVRALNTGNYEKLLLLGMSYAAKSFSVHSLRYYIRQYYRGGYGPVPQQTAIILVQALRAGLQLRLWENPTLDKTQFLHAITGADSKPHSSEGSFQSLLDLSNLEDNELVGPYVLLLGELGDLEAVSKIWSDLHSKLTTSPSKATIRSILACIESFLRLDSPNQAIDAAYQASKEVNINELCSIDVWKSLLEHDSKGILRDVISPQTVTSMVEADLESLELVLGHAWTGDENGYYIHPRAMAKFAGSNNADDIYESVLCYPDGFSRQKFVRFLQTSIKNDGYSRSRASLSRVADLLNEFEGVKVPLGEADVMGMGQVEYALFPCCSPVEFRSNRPEAGCDMNQPFTPASLGLLTVRPDGDSGMLRSHPALHLMQIGYVGARKFPVLNEDGEPETNSWAYTGHIIGWNRTSSNLEMLWIGPKGPGAIDSGLVHPTPPLILPHSFGSIEFGPYHNFQLTPCNMIGPVSEKQSYWVDVDSGNDLMP
ncbi:hypothetical protein FQN57_006005 [Myotisia sp. PD_48]|nr:hypothetical protein FQN57_006005 [Myotisia sp. PD_48]